jgi:hypothetical protein
MPQIERLQAGDGSDQAGRVKDSPSRARRPNACFRERSKGFRQTSRPPIEPFDGSGSIAHNARATPRLRLPPFAGSVSIFCWLPLTWQVWSEGAHHAESVGVASRTTQTIASLLSSVGMNTRVPTCRGTCRPRSIEAAGPGKPQARSPAVPYGARVRQWPRDVSAARRVGPSPKAPQRPALRRRLDATEQLL